MQIKPSSRQQRGSVLLTVVIVGAIVGVVAVSILTLSSTALRNAHGRVDWNKCYYISENASIWAAQKIVDNPPPVGSTNYYSTSSTNLLPAASLVKSDADFKGASVSIVQPTTSAPNVYIITSSARVNNKVRTIQATVTAYPVSQVFDYEYFLNNWGWWWGSSITGNGGQRSNWDFDFQGSPTVNGLIFAANLVEADQVVYNPNTQPAPFGGLAGASPVDYVHAGAPRVTMPNLLNFSNYTATALANTATNGIWIGSTQVVAGVQSNPNKTGIYLVGTTANPIRISGTVVVPGDVVIKGVVTGQGTLYVGGDLYVANNLTYANGPDFSTPPETMAAGSRDSWVQNNRSKDLIAYAVNGSVFGGDVTSADWINNEYNMLGSGLAHVGDESQLGQDGIADTPDDGVAFLHPPDATHNSSYMSAWYDADGDGTVNANYNYNNDINMTTARANQIQGYPTVAGVPAPYSTVATSSMGTLQGIFYTDHALAMRVAPSSGSTTFYGAVISRNEQIVFNGSCQFLYDSRVNSRYRNNPNQYINLGLPFGKTLQVNSLVELLPTTSL